MQRHWNPSLPGCNLSPLESQNTRCSSNKTTHIWLARIKFACRWSCNLNGIVSRDLVNIAECPGIYILVPLMSTSAVRILPSIKNAGIFVGIYHSLLSLPSFMGIITNYKICKDWNRVYNNTYKDGCDLRDRKCNYVPLKSLSLLMQGHSKYKVSIT